MRRERYAPLAGVTAVGLLALGAALFALGIGQGPDGGLDAFVVSILGQLLVILGIVAAFLALAGAAAGNGRLPRWAIALGTVLFGAIAIVCVWTLFEAGPSRAFAALVFALLGVYAGVRAWTRPAGPAVAAATRAE